MGASGLLGRWPLSARCCQEAHSAFWLMRWDQTFLNSRNRPSLASFQGYPWEASQIMRRACGLGLDLSPSSVLDFSWHHGTSAEKMAASRSRRKRSRRLSREVRNSNSTVEKRFVVRYFPARICTGPIISPGRSLSRCCCCAPLLTHSISIRDRKPQLLSSLGFQSHL